MLEKVIARDETASNDNKGEVKTEVVAAYHELLHKLKQNKKPAVHLAGVDDVEDEYVDTETRVEKFAEEVSREKPNDYSRAIDNLKHGVIDAIDEVREKFINEQKKLTALMEAIEQKNRKIAEIHDIEVNIDTLAALLLAQKEKSREFEDEMHDRRQAFEHEMSNKRKELQQEEQKYIYQRDLAREKDRNRYELAKRDLDQELVELRAKAHKELEEREHRVGTAEALHEKIAQFPEELRIAAQKAKDATTKQLTIQFEYENQLAQKELQIREQKIATLEAKIATLESSITHFESLKASFNHLLFKGSDA